MTNEFKSFKDFYPFYLQEHRLPKTRVLHLIGTSCAILWILGVGFFSDNWAWIWLTPIFGYGFAWVAHFHVEHNRPATFTHPIYSLIGDFRMAFDIIRYRKLLFEKK